MIPILRLISVEDGGPDGMARCPHCGAEGRWIYHFRLIDGTTAAAMMGCYKAWPKHCNYGRGEARMIERAAKKPNGKDQARLQPSPESGCSGHDWIEETLREPNFQVAYGAKRTCRRCAMVQFAEFCAGRVGGPRGDVPNDQA